MQQLFKTSQVPLTSIKLCKIQEKISFQRKSWICHVVWGHGFCSYKEFSQQFANKLLSVLKYWEGGGFICCLACFHDKKLMCSDICFLRLPAFKEFFDLDKAVRGEEPYLFCSSSTLDGIGNKCSVLQLRFPHCCFITEGSWGFSELHSVSTCRAGANFLTFFTGQKKVCTWLESVSSRLCVWFCCSPCTCSSVLLGTAKQNFGQSTVSMCAGGRKIFSIQNFRVS